MTSDGGHSSHRYQSEIRRYRESETTPPAHERKVAASGTRPPKAAAASFKQLKASPVFKDGHTLRSYQLEGLNWLLFSWYAQRSVMLAHPNPNPNPNPNPP